MQLSGGFVATCKYCNREIQWLQGSKGWIPHEVTPSFAKRGYKEDGRNGFKLVDLPEDEDSKYYKIHECKMVIK